MEKLNNTELVMTKQNLFIYNDVVYEAKEDSENKTIDFNVINPRKSKIPENLYKYYELNNKSLEAFINHYLFSSHPMRLNDKYDCTGDLIDYSNLSL